VPAFLRGVQADVRDSCTLAAMYQRQMAIEKHQESDCKDKISAGAFVAYARHLEHASKQDAL